MKAAVINLQLDFFLSILACRALRSSEINRVSDVYVAGFLQGTNITRQSGNLFNDYCNEPTNAKHN